MRKNLTPDSKTGLCLKMIGAFGTRGYLEGPSEVTRQDPELENKGWGHSFRTHSHGAALGQLLRNPQFIICKNRCDNITNIGVYCENQVFKVKA